MICHVSQYAGFCFGVSLAVNEAYQSVRDNACMLGEVVHNPTVVKDLESKGMRMVSRPDQIHPGEKALIRAHGVSEAVYESLRRLAIPVIDRTCPKVRKIHDIVRRECDKGRLVVIVGNRTHPEVIGIIGWCENAVVVQSESDARALVDSLSGTTGDICLVSQTTFNKSKYEHIRDMLVSGGLNVFYHDTICLDTSNRQREVTSFAGSVDCVIVVGGMNSSNSSKLYEIAAACCPNAMHVESACDIDLDAVLRCSNVFITGGASTPIENITLAVETLKNACRARGVPFTRGETAKGLRPLEPRRGDIVPPDPPSSPHGGASARRRAQG